MQRALRLAVVTALAVVAAYLVWAVIPLGVAVVFGCSLLVVGYIAHTFGVVEKQNREHSSVLQATSATQQMLYHLARENLRLQEESKMVSAMDEFRTSLDGIHRLLEQVLQHHPASVDPDGVVELFTVGDTSAGAHAAAVASPRANRSRN